MSKRSSWKNVYVNQNLMFRLNKIKNLKIFERNSTITPEFLNKKVKIHNGKVFISVFVDESKLGFKFGEFAYSRKRCLHKSKIKVKKKK